MSKNSVFLSSGDWDLGIAFQFHPGSQASSRVEAKNSTLLLSCDGYLLEPIEWPKGSQASCVVLRGDSELLSRPCRKRRASSLDDGAILWFFSSCRGKGPHLTLMEEPCGFSRVVAGFSSYDDEHREPLMLPQRNSISFRVARGSWGLFSRHCRACRPHLGLCPETPCSSPVATGISGLHSMFTGESGLISSGSKELCSLLDGYLLEPTEWPKGSQASCGVLREDSGLLSRSCRKRKASSHIDGGISWFFSICEGEHGIALESQQGNWA